MKQEDKELLLRYFSIALPYGLKMQNPQEDCHVELCGIDLDNERIRYYTYKDPSLTVVLNRDLIICEKLQFKPYLRPMSSMTEEEKEEDRILLWTKQSYHEVDWWLKKRFDFLGLIPKGLAIEVTEENNPYNITEE